MRPRARSYRGLDGLSAERDAVSWIWRSVALGSSLMILGGYLMLPATFYNNTSALRVSQAGIGIFAVALLTAGFSLTGLLCFAVRNVLFQAEFVFLPSLTSSALGLLTVFYDFLVYQKYVWNTPALLTTIAAAISTVVYGMLLIYTQRKISALKSSRPNGPGPMPLAPSEHRDSEQTLWRGASEPPYYENYVRNMFPSSTHAPQQQWQPSPASGGGYDPNAISEEELQRQQMLMLLLQGDQFPTADTSSSTYNIEWQGRDEDEGPPMHGYYAPNSQSPQVLSPQAQSAYRSPRPGVMRQWTNELRPWDGVLRAPARVDSSSSGWLQRPTSTELREARRREIEAGGR